MKKQIPSRSQNELSRQSRLLALSSEMACVLDEAGRITYSNSAWQQTMGQEADALASVPLLEFVMEEDRAVLQSEMAALLGEGQSASFEARFLCGDGTACHLECRAARFENEISISARDVTERKEQEQALSDAYQKLTYYMLNSPLAFVEWDRSLSIQYWSPETEKVFGWSADETLDKRPQDWKFLHEEDAADFLSLMSDLAEDNNPRAFFQGRHYRRDGAVAHCEWYHSALRDESGQVVSIFSFAVDITERKRREAELTQIRKAVESASDAICIADAAGKITYLNPAFDVLFGSLDAEMNHSGVNGLITDEKLRQQIADNVGLGLSWQGEVEIRCGDGALVPVMLRANAIRDEQGQQIGCITVCTDLRERKQAEKELIHQAMHDSLTGLPNRSYFHQRLERAFDQSKPTATSVACMFIDLDNFKIINDSLGHEAGDDLLQTIASRLQSCMRPEDMVARLGGDEFVILIEEMQNMDHAIAMAERVSSTLKNSVRLAGRDVIVTASVGIALSQPGHEQASALLRDADVAMYQAKTGGKANYVVFDTSMNAEAMERLELEIDLRRAVERKELELYFQPIINLTSSNITEVEALARWNHPERGLIPPLKFIPIAEETGLIIPIGDWVLQEACDYARKWQSLYPSAVPLIMSVNLSTRQLQQENLVAKVQAVLEVTGIEPNSLKLEITESVMLLDCDATITKLHALKALGIRLAVDDFGTGYSSMAYLSNLPIDTLKIDRSFINKLGIKAEDDAIVRAILMMAQTMGLSVTAEGIETDAQREELNTLGCDRGQGYYFARPLTALKCGEMLESHSRRQSSSLPSVAPQERRAA